MTLMASMAHSNSSYDQTTVAGYYCTARVLVTTITPTDFLLEHRSDRSDSFKMPTRRELHSSDDSNPSSGTQASLGSAVTGATQYFVPHENTSPAQSDRHSLWTRLDRSGRNGIRDRLQRRGRMARSIHLSPQQLREILHFIYENEDSEGVRWTREVLFTYVRRVFETSAVSEASARMALEQAISRNSFSSHPSVSVITIYLRLQLTIQSILLTFPIS